MDAARLAAPRRRHAPVRGVPEAFDRLADALLGDDPGPEADDLSTVEGCRAALRSASFAAMIAAHDLADCDRSSVGELEADLAEHRAREEASSVALRALRGAGVITLRRASARRAWLSGPRDALAPIASAAGLTAREAVDGRLLVVEHERESVLVAACAAQGVTVTPTCALCEAGVCCVHGALGAEEVCDG